MCRSNTLFSLVLGIVFLIQTAVSQSPQTYFTHPPDSGVGSLYDTDEVFELGSTLNVTWVTNETYFGIWLWQQNTATSIASVNDRIVYFQRGGVSPGHVLWTVNTESFDLGLSNIFFFNIGPYPSLTDNLATCHYFNITRQPTASPSISSKSLVTSSSSSAVTSTTTTTSTSTSTSISIGFSTSVTSITRTSSITAAGAQITNSPTVSPISVPDNGPGSNSVAIKVGLGVGLGIGIPLLLLLGAYFGYKVVHNARKKQARAHPEADDNEIHKAELPSDGVISPKIELPADGIKPTEVERPGFVTYKSDRVAELP